MTHRSSSTPSPSSALMKDAKLASTSEQASTVCSKSTIAQPEEQHTKTKLDTDVAGYVFSIDDALKRISSKTEEERRAFRLRWFGVEVLDGGTQCLDAQYEAAAYTSDSDESGQENPASQQQQEQKQQEPQQSEPPQESQQQRQH